MEESHMLKIIQKTIPPPCLKNFISLSIPFSFSQNFVILPSQRNPSCEADALFKNSQPKHPAQ